MPKTKMITYQCPRCGYENGYKSKMKRHFFENRTVCPIALNNIDLTPDICETVLKNRRYVVEKNTIINKVKNYNTMNNFINNLDVQRKLENYLNFQNKPLVEFGDQLDYCLEKRKRRLTDKTYKTPYILDESGLAKLVDTVTKVERNQLDNLNVLFDKKLKQFKIYQDDQWNSYLEETGIAELISLIKTYYLNDYETYLVYNLHCDHSKVTNRLDLKKHLEIYYHFLAIFNLPISIFGSTDQELIGHRLKEDNDYFIVETYAKLYETIKEKIKTTERNRYQKKIQKIVKDNSIHNMSELNTAILNLLEINEEFRKIITS